MPPTCPVNEFTALMLRLNARHAGCMLPPENRNEQKKCAIPWRIAHRCCWLVLLDGLGHVQQLLPVLHVLGEVLPRALLRELLPFVELRLVHLRDLVCLLYTSPRPRDR